jgi:hypothetical protein
MRRGLYRPKESDVASPGIGRMFNGEATIANKVFWRLSKPMKSLGSSYRSWCRTDGPAFDLEFAGASSVTIRDRWAF